MLKKFRITTSLFNYKELIPKLADKGRQLYGDHFRLYYEDLPVIFAVLCWFLRDEDVAAQFNIDLKKGIFLTGPTGAGKTRLMALMNHIKTDIPMINFQGCTTDAISTCYAQQGSSLISEFNQYKNPCFFDDLGAESVAFYYGNGCEVMKKILLGRYELFCNHGTITHATSRLSSSEIEARYGSEIRSRMREMFNYCTFSGATADKRKIL